MANTKIKKERDWRTPLTGLLTTGLCVLAYVFFCVILIVVVRFLAG